MNEEIISFIDFTNMNDEEKYKLLNSKDYEIERLNNIINELGKYHKIQMGIASDEIDNQYCLGRYDSSYDSFQKLQELKGGDK